MRIRYQPLKEDDGTFVVINVEGRNAFVYALENCKHCLGTGSMGRQEGCRNCLGEGEKNGAKCDICKGTGKGESGEKHLLPCPCLKNEFDMEEKEEYID